MNAGSNFCYNATDSLISMPWAFSLCQVVSLFYILMDLYFVVVLLPFLCLILLSSGMEVRCSVILLHCSDEYKIWSI